MSVRCFPCAAVSKLAPTDLVTLLDRIWSKYDELSDKHGVQKMETVGATYMAVGGLNMGADNAQPIEITEMALACITAASEVPAVELAVPRSCSTAPASASVLTTRPCRLHAPPPTLVHVRVDTS